MFLVLRWSVGSAWTSPPWSEVHLRTLQSNDAPLHGSHLKRKPRRHPFDNQATGMFGGLKPVQQKQNRSLTQSQNGVAPSGDAYFLDSVSKFWNPRDRHPLHVYSMHATCLFQPKSVKTLDILREVNHLCYRSMVRTGQSCSCCPAQDSKNSACRPVEAPVKGPHYTSDRREKNSQAFKAEQDKMCHEVHVWKVPKRLV